jgi:AraC-like DNA-binding protein
MVTMYITYAIVAIYPFACIFWNDTQPMVFLWYFCTIIGALIFDTKHIIQYVAMTIISVVAVFLFAAMLFPHEHFTQEVLLQSSMLTVLAGIFLSGFFVIVFILQINRQRVEAEEQMQETVKVAETNEKEKALYREIMRYMEESKCFANPDFSAQMLAKAIGSNYNYVSKAISTCCETGDFRALLNQFRIAYAKEMLDDGAMSKYTLDHIFTKAGYNHRSTFNTAFRNIVGMTPSDYIAQKNAATASATSVRNHTVS